MKKRLITLLVPLLLLSLAIVPQTAQAKTLHPTTTTDCTFVCAFTLSWLGNTHGGKEDWDVSHPNLGCSGSTSYYWLREEMLYKPSTSDELEIGALVECHINDSGNCKTSHSSTALMYFVKINLTDVDCWVAPSGNDNYITLFQSGNFTSEGGRTTRLHLQ